MASPSIVLVKEPAGQYTSDLIKACEDHLSRVYPDCVNSFDHGTVMCPPAFPFNYIAPVGEASGATPLSDIEKVTFNGDRAELNVFHAVEKFGRETKQSMFVLTKFKVKELVKEILQQNLPADHSIMAKLQRLESDLDLLIIHRKIGVIIIEVKATEEFKKPQYRKAKKEINDGVEVIQALFHAVAISRHKEVTRLPIYKVIAMPNVTNPGQAHGGFINLRKGDLHSGRDFQCWWREHFVQKEFTSHQEQELQKLMAILVGQETAVSSPAKVLSDVFKKIDTQSFLQRSHDKCAKQKMDGPEMVVKTADKPDLAILAKRFMFLNPEQQGIWNGPHHQIFTGVAGSGKTILLQFKALECAMKGEKVVVMVPTPLTTLYKDFFKINRVSSEVVVASYFEFEWLIDECKLPTIPGKGSGKLHFFADEGQSVWGMQLKRFFEPFLTKLSKCQDCYCWIAYDDKQYISKAISPHTFQFQKSFFQTTIQNFLNKNGFYHAASLTTVMRSTFEVYSYLNSACYRSSDISYRKYNGFCVKDMAHFYFPLDKYWLYSVQLGHQICGPSVTEIVISDLKMFIQVIKKEIDFWARDGEVYSYQKVAILATSSDLATLSFIFTVLEEIPFCNLGDDKNGVVLAAAETTHSYEWPVVLAVCLDKRHQLKYLMFSQAVTRLVVMCVPPYWLSLFSGSIPGEL